MTRITSYNSRRPWQPLLLLVLAAVGIGVAFGVARTGEAASQTVPNNTAPPVITGELKVGSTLTTSNGTWTGTPAPTFTYVWQRCDENGGSCAAISGATANTYVLKNADAGSTLRSVVRGTNTDGNDSSTSVPTGVVGGAPASNGCPTGTGGIQIADLSPPARLQIDQQTTAPSLITGSTNQIILHARITACSGRPVQGALVEVQVTPYNQFAGQQGTTGADGTVNVTLTRQAAFPASAKQQLLVMFVKARKNGEDPLGGISNGRLVSFPVSLG
jgi:hypothetical protein